MECDATASPFPATNSDSDGRHRTKKKYKRVRSSSDDGNESLSPMEEISEEGKTEFAPLEGQSSYKDMLTGNGNSQSSFDDDWGSEMLDGQIYTNEDVSEDEFDEESANSRVLFSKEEKGQMRKPWRNALIVKGKNSWLQNLVGSYQAFMAA